MIHAMGNVEIDHSPVPEHVASAQVSPDQAALLGLEEDSTVREEEEVLQEDHIAGAPGRLQEYVNNPNSCGVSLVSESVVLVDLSSLFPSVTSRHGTEGTGGNEEEAMEEEDGIIELSDVHIIASSSDDACCESGVVSTVPSTDDDSQCDEGESS